MAGLFRKELRELLPYSLGTQFSQGSTAGTARSYELKQEELEKRRAIYLIKFTGKRFKLSFDIDEDNELEEIIVHYH